MRTRYKTKAYCAWAANVAFAAQYVAGNVKGIDEEQK